MSNFEFEPWPKIARLNRDITISEKIDGTNAAVIIAEDGLVAAQSRSRIITPDADNFGFARWVYEHAAELLAHLGPGRHFGEWWGSGIQRKYGMTGRDKRFSLFNTARYAGLEVDFGDDGTWLGTVPVLYQGPFDQAEIDRALLHLKIYGSRASEGFMDPEGIIVFHSAAQQMFKVTIQGDEAPKSVMVGAS